MIPIYALKICTYSNKKYLFIVQCIGIFTCKCGVTTSVVLDELINCVMNCEKFDEVITSFIYINIHFIPIVRAQFNEKLGSVMEGRLIVYILEYSYSIV